MWPVRNGTNIYFRGYGAKESVQSLPLGCRDLSSPGDVRHVDTSFSCFRRSEALKLFGCIWLSVSGGPQGEHIVFPCLRSSCIMPPDSSVATTPPPPGGGWLLWYSAWHRPRHHLAFAQLAAFHVFCNKPPSPPLARPLPAPFTPFTLR